MADTPILNYKGKHDGPEIDKAVELALGLENPKSCPYYVHVSLSQPDYVLTIGLADAEGKPFNHAEIDLPLESMVVNATYSNGNIILHLQDGTSTEPIPISALIAGLVSETRTIAGIDLEDDITQKELRDALDVYTKDSVDLLVSDLENTINETLNEMKQSLDDLSELTSEHDTQIKKNTSDIAVNRATLGTQKKNLFNKDGEINLIYIGSKQPNSSLYSTVSGNVITFKAAITKANMSGQFIPNVKNKKIIISGNLSSIESSTSGDSLAIRAYIRKNETPIFNTRRGTTGEFSYTVDCGENNEVFICMGLFYGDGLVKVENLMVRYADITDGTYEPYTPSLQEQINNNQNDILNSRGLFLPPGLGISEKTFTYDATAPHGSPKAHTGALLVTLYDWITDTKYKENLYLVSWNGGIAYTRFQPILESNTRLSLTSVTGGNGVVTFVANTSGWSITPLHAGTLVT